MGGLTHLGDDGRARMVDVGGKPTSERRAVARARLRMAPDTARAVELGDGPKGEVLGVARIAGVQAAKQTSTLIPLCHPLPLSFVDLTATVDAEAGLVELHAEDLTLGTVSALHRASRVRRHPQPRPRDSPPLAGRLRPDVHHPRPPVVPEVRKPAHPATSMLMGRKPPI